MSDETNAAQESHAILEGHIAITAALEADSRPIEAVYLERGRRDRRGHLVRLARLAEARGIPVERAAAEVLARHVSGSTHGGAIALAGPRRFVKLADLIPPAGSRAAAGRAPFVAMIDGVEDPFNFGQAIRALYAAGADGLVVRPRNWMSAAGVVGRASAGASERIPTAVAETALAAADFYRGQGLTVATTARDRRAVPLYDADLSGPLFVLIGGEKRGITRSFLDKADLILEIPYGRDFRQSLGTTAAAAVLTFEIMHQRGG